MESPTRQPWPNGGRTLYCPCWVENKQTKQDKLI